MVANIQEYRKKYYLQNKEYLLKYQKWHIANKKYKKGLISLEEVPKKPDKHKRNIINKKKEENTLIISKGHFIVSFDDFT